MDIMALLTDVLGPIAANIIVFAVFILFVIIVLWLILKLFRSTPFIKGGRQRRLGQIDAYQLDNKRRLVIIRRDDVEHLLLIGGVSDIVVEQNIVRGRSTQQQSIHSRTSITDNNSSTPSTNSSAPLAKNLSPASEASTSIEEKAPLKDNKNQPVRQEPRFESSSSSTIQTSALNQSALNQSSAETSASAKEPLRIEPSLGSKPQQEQRPSSFLETTMKETSQATLSAKAATGAALDQTTSLMKDTAEGVASTTKSSAQKARESVSDLAESIHKTYSTEKPHSADEKSTEKMDDKGSEASKASGPAGDTDRETTERPSQRIEQEMAKLLGDLKRD